MGSKELRLRTNWQTLSGGKALKAEDMFAVNMQLFLDRLYPGLFIVDKHPTEFNDIYSNFELPDEVLNEIYNVDVKELKKNGLPRYNWGISMDFAIRNQKNGKILFGEIKRQDGWIETTNPAAGRGNAHERSAKYFTPGLLKTIREKSSISDEILPFWLVLAGDITRDPKRNREIAFWYQGYEKNYYMWRDYPEFDKIALFFEIELLPYLL